METTINSSPNLTLLMETAVDEHRWWQSLDHLPERMSEGLQPLVAGFGGISLEEMNDIRLMNRTDKKFVVNALELQQLISLLMPDYKVQEIGKKRISSYGTIYLDTPDLWMYHTHMNGKLNRFKWRIRSYEDSNLSFLEIKRKTNKGRTRKSRIEFNPFYRLEDGVAADFIFSESGMESRLLQPVLQNHFHRITFVNRQKTERVTVDFDINFRNCLNEYTSSANNLAIVEIKQDQSCGSAIGRYLEDRRVKPSGISKYCLGLAMTTENLKRNSYKQKIRSIHKITG
jgi:hypothetical protein